ncbi:MAG: hypothetical protein ABEJ56_02080 [Candidatus Nanohaloarchaea archaeon]
MVKSFLRQALLEESRAYGFTIAFWGSGALLVKYSGLPDIQQAIFYGLGAVAGFGILTLYSYRNAFSKADFRNDRVMILGMIHYLGALVPIMSAYYTSRLASPLNFFLTGLLVSILYNMGMVVEQVLNEKGRKLEGYLETRF